MKLIDAEALKAEILKAPVWTGLDAIAKINTMPSIELDDYVPKDFHDKTCEAMAKRHQEEIADMVEVVRCKECKHRYVEEQSWGEYNEFCDFWCDGNGYWASVNADDFCSYGEKKGADDETN